MSVWTHVNASIRFDGIRGITELPDEKAFGEIRRFEDRDVWGPTILPLGREGSLEYQIINNPDPSSTSCMVVVFWGDLRDYYEHEPILEYFEKITEGQMIRSGILEISVGSEENPHIFRFNQDSQKWEKWTQS